jgi:hypothetical protein
MKMTVRYEGEKIQPVNLQCEDPNIMRP